MLGYVASFTNLAAIATANVFAGKATSLRDWRVTFRLTSFIILIITWALALLDKAEFQSESFFIGLIAGISGGLGIPLAYKAFAQGSIAYVSPLLAIVQTTSIVSFALSTGEPLKPILIFAFFMGMVGIYLSSKPTVLDTTNLFPISVITISAALLFSGFSIGMTRIETGQNITGLAGARTGVFLVALGMIKNKPRKTSIESKNTWLIFTVLSAFLEFLANFTYVIAIANLDLSKVGIIISTSSIFATLVAIPVMKQKPRIVNWIGIMIATFSLVLVAIS